MRIPLLVFVVSVLGCRPTQEVPPAPLAPIVLTPRDCGTMPTTEEMQAVSKRIWDEDLPDVMNTFPGEKTRAAIAQLQSLHQTDRLQIQWLFGDFPGAGSFRAKTGAYTRPDGTRIALIGVSMPNQLCAERAIGRELARIEVVAYLVHELYHVEHHAMREKPSLEELRAGEEEAWLDTCGSVLEEMHAAGFLQQLSSGDPLPISYDRCRIGRQNPKDPAWQQFLDLTVGKR